MTIRIYEDKIEFVKNDKTFTLEQTETGFSLDSILTAISFHTLFQGTVAGYVSGGSPGSTNVIEKFSFAVNANSTDVGDLTVSRDRPTGLSSDTHGYTCGNDGGAAANVIDKFPFASDANATDVGDLHATAFSQRAPTSSQTHGYLAGGTGTPGVIRTPIIERFSFAVDGNSFEVGGLSVSRGEYPGGQTSDVSGYATGGGSPPSTALRNVIDKFPFASEGNATDVGDLTRTTRFTTGQSSVTHGYTSGGGPPAVNVIDKFSFAVNANATDVGNLTTARFGVSGQSSTESGYTSGGSPSNVIDKFPFATDTDATDVGDLVAAKIYLAGHQD